MGLKDKQGRIMHQCKKEMSVGIKVPAQHRVHRTSAGAAHTFGVVAPKGGFGIRWFFPPIPALAGNASRWAALKSPDQYRTRLW